MTLKIKYPPAFYAVVLVKSTIVSEEPSALVIELKRHVLCKHNVLLLSKFYISKYNEQASHKWQGLCLGKNLGGAHSTDGELLLFRLFCGNGENSDE